MKIRTPAIAYLNGSRLRRGLRAGIERLTADCDQLNAINVFPVADGDTGTNLVMTMNSVLFCLARDQQEHAGRTLTRVADAALDGARGNSGAILAQFFQGLSDTVGEFRILTLEQFIRAAHAGARYAREALSDPKEGTLLTVLTDFAEALSEHPDRHDLVPLLESGLHKAEISLAHTREQLEPLRKAGVVDAGAKGFVDLLEGIMDFIRSGKLQPRRSEQMPELVRAEFHRTSIEQDLEYRFCTECMITGEGIDRRKLRESLASLGGSVVVAGTHRKVRIHVHVNEPAVVFEVATRYGAISSEKADDMRRQQHRPRSRIAIVTDSACDLPDAELERLNIHVVPLRIHFGERGYLDKVSISTETFYEQLVTNPHHPKTSQPAPGDFRRQFELLASHYEAVVSINVTAKVSGTWQAAVSAAERVEPGRLEVIDSRNASLGQGLIVMHAAECALAGQSVEEILASLEDVIPKTRTYAMIGDLEYGVRGGRIPRSKKLLADWLRLTPVIGNTVDGRVSGAGVLFGRSQSVDKFARHLLRRLDRRRRYRIGVGHARNPLAADRLLDRFASELPHIDTLISTEVGTAFGAHGGPGTLVVSIQERH